jgi:secretion/DNA translocation related CpaE-like protein
VVGTSEPAPPLWAAAVEVGAQQLCVLPAQEAELVRQLSEAAEMGRGAPHRGRVIAVTAGRGGGGASVFAAALAQRAGEALLVDLDPCGGGVDLLLGVESAPGMRWPEMATASGRLSWAAVREVLPHKGDISMLSCTRNYHEIDPVAAQAVVDAGRRGGATVICDLPRPLNSAALGVLENTDLVVIVTSCDVRAVAATGPVAGVIRAVNPNLGLVVRGPAPGGLRAAEVVEVTAVPLLAAMRPEPMLAVQLEQGGLRLRRRSPLAVAARKVLDVLHSGTGIRAA